ncbi:hypothetical protein [Aequorivita sp. CIP111184]|uniref:hypothetical protein n=1 Tax=Aequorivita sp. CIP111184 TaxID=2211356 RepID=UPI000DBC43E7|nr:hypothetical protein [Aequorivita sp. CIP111184]SRX55433.1 hypothetical protein AEQU1_02455 [Aequorivita sp. CIP111184]
MELSIAETTSSDWWNFWVNASTGKIIDKDNWTVSCSIMDAHNEHYHGEEAITIPTVVGPLNANEVEKGYGKTSTNIINELTATNDYGNTTTCELELTVETILGVGDNSANIGSLQMYLNPAMNTVTIGNPESILFEKLSIFDIRGRMIKSIDLRNMGIQQTIDVSEMIAAT